MAALPQDRFGNYLGPVKPDKGKPGGSCNRVACQASGAVYYNRSTRRYYCPECAARINAGGVGLDGSPLCLHPSEFPVDPDGGLRLVRSEENLTGRVDNSVGSG
jgi:hypothetical protein